MQDAPQVQVPAVLEDGEKVAPGVPEVDIDRKVPLRGEFQLDAESLLLEGAVLVAFVVVEADPISSFQSGPTEQGYRPTIGYSTPGYRSLTAQRASRSRLSTSAWTILPTPAARARATAASASGRSHSS